MDTQNAEARSHVETRSAGDVRGCTSVEVVGGAGEPAPSPSTPARGASCSVLHRARELSTRPLRRFL